MSKISRFSAIYIADSLEKISLFSLAEWTLLRQSRAISLLLRFVIIASLFLAFLDVLITQQAVLPNIEFATLALVAGFTMGSWFFHRGRVMFTSIVLGTFAINLFALGNIVGFGPQLFSTYVTHALYLAPLCVVNGIIFRPRPALVLNGLMLVMLLIAAAAAVTFPLTANHSALIVRAVVVLTLHGLFLAAVYVALNSFMRVRGQLTEAMRLVRTLELHDAANRESEKIRNQITRFHRIGIVEAMSASLAHELNQPIGAALGYVQAGRRWLRRNPPAITEALAAGNGAAAQLERAIAVMSDIRKMATLVPSKPARVDVGLHLRGMLDLLRGEYRDAGVKVNYSEPDEATLRFAEVRIEEIGQVVLNLVRNAIEAFPKDGESHRIDVSLCSADKGWLEILVSDNGPGIPPAQISQVFDPFFTTKDNGSGLGLSICRSIAERHGGSLNIKNRPGGGAQAIFAFPVTVARP